MWWWWLESNTCKSFKLREVSPERGAREAATRESRRQGTGSAHWGQRQDVALDHQGQVEGHRTGLGSQYILEYDSWVWKG